MKRLISVMTWVVMISLTGSVVGSRVGMAEEPKKAPTQAQEKAPKASQWQTLKEIYVGGFVAGGVVAAATLKLMNGLQGVFLFSEKDLHEFMQKFQEGQRPEASLGESLRRSKDLPDTGTTRPQSADSEAARAI